MSLHQNSRVLKKVSSAVDLSSVLGKLGLCKVIRSVRKRKGSPSRHITSTALQRRKLEEEEGRRSKFIKQTGEQSQGRRHERLASEYRLPA